VASFHVVTQAELLHYVNPILTATNISKEELNWERISSTIGLFLVHGFHLVPRSVHTHPVDTQRVDKGGEGDNQPP
jgi:hypothetical protein